MENSDSPPDRYAVVGFPVDHSRSPMIHSLFARQTGQHMTYELLPAEPEDFETAVRGFAVAGGKGLNVTVPHKEAAFELATERSPEAERARAVNTLTLHTPTRIQGDNTDGVGFLRDLTKNNEQTLEGKRALVLGAGGAARGILPPLLDAKLAELTIANRTIDRADQLVELFDAEGDLSACRFDELADKGAFDLVVNATSAGLKGETPPFPPDCIGPESFCYDLAYSLGDTPFVQWAREHGAGRAIQGWGMLIEQAAESFEIWRGVRPETAPILEKLTNR